ncbi:MAG: acyltransferase [Oligoflexia bacterium]|nr:acyltransferase [Oligoflexia bacterium]MBF0364210.1 acyltransferase [Oligoflexia bacterium]
MYYIYLTLPQNILIIFPALLVLLIPAINRRYFFCTDVNVVAAKLPKSKHIGVEDARYQFYDFLKGIGMLAVVAIHVTYIYKNNIVLYNRENSYYHVNNFINNFSRFTIPFFLLISGILLRPFAMQKVAIYDFYKKKLLRLIPPYILCVIAIHWDKPISEIWSLGITGKADVPYYFMLVLFQCYFLYPLLLFLKKTPRFTLNIILIISVVSAIYPYFWNLYEFPLCLKYLFFFAYGAYAREYFINYEKSKNIDFWVWIFFIIYYLSYILFFSNYYYNTRFFWGPAAFHLVFYFRDFIINFKIANRFFSFIGKFSLWIFLIHYQILLMFKKYFEQMDYSFYMQQLYALLATFFVSVIISCLLDLGYSKISRPFLKRNI